MRPQHFAITRADGRSNSQVILDTVKQAEPGRLFTYRELTEALSIGTGHVYDHRAVCSAVRAATTRLLHEAQRRLHNVPLAGYRVAPASEHMRLARTDKRRADVQLRRGVETLRHVRWDELDPNARAAHEGTLMVTEALYVNQVALDARIRKIEEAIAAAKKGTT